MCHLVDLNNRIISPQILETDNIYLLYIDLNFEFRIKNYYININNILKKRGGGNTGWKMTLEMPIIFCDYFRNMTPKPCVKVIGRERKSITIRTHIITALPERCYFPASPLGVAPIARWEGTPLNKRGGGLRLGSIFTRLLCKADQHSLYLYITLHPPPPSPLLSSAYQTTPPPLPPSLGCSDISFILILAFSWSFLLSVWNLFSYSFECIREDLLGGVECVRRDMMIFS